MGYLLKVEAQHFNRYAYKAEYYRLLICFKYTLSRWAVRRFTRAGVKEIYRLYTRLQAGCMSPVGYLFVEIGLWQAWDCRGPVMSEE